ncbi:purine-cytosine permease family protein [Luteipulveratus mongoliensis]|uniref:Allantoin permease n=1 Tax=Luteipulveratus mongoliensis TaxID=571913 RepID=A0A0K1JEN3_9MICO|nr:cytosine permease [Luteipulveratus mongoliensis]AKU15172.1 allantoin permease [Luteipulveratus mongoliensis]
MATPLSAETAPAKTGAAASVEANGLNVIAESERHGTPRSLFWPWFAANISVLAIPYGAYVLGFGLSFWQALLAMVLGTILSFLLCGFVSLAGKRGSAPTMVLSRASFGVDGNRVPAFLSWLLLVGWETVLVVLATLASATVFDRLGWGGGNETKVIALIVVAGITVVTGVFGFQIIMKVQTWITLATGVLTVVYIALSFDEISWDAVTAHKSGGLPEVIGAVVLLVTALGLGWTNAAADYSRYLPRGVSGKGVVFWPTFGASLGPLVLIFFGILLAGSDEKISAAVQSDPIGALTTILPTWFLVPFALVAILGLIGGTVLDIYSSGLSMLSMGIKVPRYVAALIDGVVMTVGAVAVVFFADDFVGPFQGFLITGGVPLAAWCGIFLADMMLRRRDYHDEDLYDARGRYGSVRWSALALLALGTAVGWGLVTNTFADWLEWQGYLLDPFNLGGKEGTWAYAGLGVLVSLAIGFIGTALLTRGEVARQEALDDAPTDTARAEAPA